MQCLVAAVRLTIIHQAHQRRIIRGAAARAAFDEKEAQAFGELSALCNDATWLKSYMCKAMFGDRDAGLRRLINSCICHACIAGGTLLAGRDDAGPAHVPTPEGCAGYPGWQLGHCQRAAAVP
eukprot:364776-Chlamydomonas_euryale.AAC.5